MIRKRLQVNTHAVSTLVVALIIVIVVGSVAAVMVGIFFFGFPRQVIGSGTLGFQTEDYADFSVVEAGWGFEVDIHEAPSYVVNVTADDNLFDYIESSKIGNRLTLGLKWGYRYVNVTLRAEITMPDLQGLTLSGGVNTTAVGFISSHDFVLALSGGSTVALEGAANNLALSGSGGCQLHLLDFPVHNVTVNLSGGSQGIVNLDGRLTGNLSGGSHLTYVGTPTAVVVNTSGGSTVGPE
jgi:hypothetical protein